MSFPIKRDLFGGTLRCAGLVAAAVATSTASAEFAPAAIPDGYDWRPNLVQCYATGVFSNPSAYESTFAGMFPTPVSYVAAGLAMSAYSGASLMGAALNMTDGASWSGATVETIQWLTIADLSKQVTLEWDLIAASSAIAYVYEVGYNVITPVAIEGTAGSVDVTFTNTLSSYIFYCRIEMDGVAGGAYARLVNVPAPGAIALLGISMVGARRRRRA